MVSDELFRELLDVVTSLAQGETARYGGTSNWDRCSDIRKAMDERISIAVIKRQREEENERLFGKL